MGFDKVYREPGKIARPSKEGNPVIRETIKYLETVEPKKMLTWNPLLCASAKGFV